MLDNLAVLQKRSGLRQLENYNVLKCFLVLIPLINFGEILITLLFKPDHFKVKGKGVYNNKTVYLKNEGTNLLIKVL
jgi:hypothetical protein